MASVSSRARQCSAADFAHQIAIRFSSLLTTALALPCPCSPASVSGCSRPGMASVNNRAHQCNTAQKTLRNEEQSGVAAYYPVHQPCLALPHLQACLGAPGPRWPLSTPGRASAAAQPLAACPAPAAGRTGFAEAPAAGGVGGSVEGSVGMDAHRSEWRVYWEGWGMYAKGKQCMGCMFIDPCHSRPLGQHKQQARRVFQRQVLGTSQTAS